MSRTIDALSCAGSNCVGVVVGMIHGPRGGVELAVREPEGVAGEDAGGAVVDDGLVMQGMTRRMHALEHAPGEFETLAVLRDRDTIARDGQDLAVQLRIQLVAVHGARACDEFRRIDHVRRTAWMHHRSGVRAARASVRRRRRHGRGARGSGTGTPPHRAPRRARRVRRGSAARRCWGRYRRSRPAIPTPRCGTHPSAAARIRCRRR